MAQLVALAQVTPTPVPVPPVTPEVAAQVAQNQAYWLVVALFFQMILGVGIGMLLIPYLFRPSRPNPVKQMPYESGMPPIGEAQQRYTIRYYVIAMLFVVFDIEAVFFYPWAVAFDAIGWYGLIEMVLFIGLLLVAYVYAWRKGALDWVS
jgi:NADH-quinone oxidoreductase subunit A